jgi:DNA-binding transcriptional LysR family regulator
MIHDLNQLACFVAVAEELHFGRAAERLCMTQPPLSRQIQLLEHSLGVRLLERTSRIVRLTAAGRVFLSDATRLLNLAKQAATTAQRTSRGEIGRVIVGFTTIIGFDMMPGLIVSAQRKLPDIDVVLKEMFVMDQFKALESNTIDVGFLYPLTSRLSLKYQTISYDPMMVVLPLGHPLASRDTIALSDLNDLPFIMYSSRFFHDFVNGLLLSSGVIPRFIQYLEQVLSVVNLVRTGMGVSIVPATASRFRFDDVVFKPINQRNAVAERRMVWRADNQNPALDAFRRFVSEYLIAN